MVPVVMAIGEGRENFSGRLTPVFTQEIGQIPHDRTLQAELQIMNGEKVRIAPKSWGGNGVFRCIEAVHREIDAPTVADMIVDHDRFLMKGSECRESPVHDKAKARMSELFKEALVRFPELPEERARVPHQKNRLKTWTFIEKTDEKRSKPVRVGARLIFFNELKRATDFPAADHDAALGFCE